MLGNPCSVVGKLVAIISSNGVQFNHYIDVRDIVASCRR